MEKALLAKAMPQLEQLKGGGKQPSEILWNGGYWHQFSTKPNGNALDADTSKAKWRVEYLPSATEILVTGFISGVAGYLGSLQAVGDFRVTLHRTLFVGSEPTLQQAAPYAGPTKRFGDAGRTFDFSNGAIGYAATARKAIRTRRKADKETDEEYVQALKNDMEVLRVETHSQPNPAARSILSVPIFGPSKTVVAVLYADSTKCNVFTDECVSVINQMCLRFGAVIDSVRLDRVSNFSVLGTNTPTALKYDAQQLKATEAVVLQSEEVATTANSLNLEFTDFVTLRKESNSA
jgi:hypothetical protein